MMPRLPPSVSGLILTFLFAPILLSAASPVPDLVPNRVVDPPTKAGIYPRQASVRMGKRMAKKPEPLQKQDYSSFLCPASAVACPVVEPGMSVTSESIAKLSEGLNSLADWFTVGFECVDLATELNQCGGCLALGEGQDCADVPNARATGCDKSTCTVYSCFDGFTISPDRKSCIKKGAETTTPPPGAVTVAVPDQMVLRDRTTSL